MFAHYSLEGNRARRKRALFQLVAVCLIFGGLAFIGCKTDDDSDKGSDGLDSKLVGSWVFEYEYPVGVQNTERFIITANKTANRIGTIEYATVSGSSVTINYRGDIRYARKFDNQAGVIVLEYQSGYEQSHSKWTQDSQGNWTSTPVPSTGNFYGVYYANLKKVKERNNRWEVFLANTSDQKNNYGPTETATLELAKAKFTEGNINNLMDVSVGDPQHKLNISY